MKITNTNMHRYFIDLQGLLQCKGLLGYAVARNIRILSSECTEYLDIYQKLLEKYGTTKRTDTDTGYSEYLSIEKTDANFAKFIEEITPFAHIEHDVPIFKVSYKDAMDQLTAEQMLTIDFMLEDTDEGVATDEVPVHND